MLGCIEEELQRMQEGIMEIPIRMLRDVHDQVCVVCICGGWGGGAGVL